MKIIVASALSLLFAGLAAAQSGGSFAITQSVISNGGDASSGGTFSVTGTIGQPLAGGTSSNGGFGLSSGFWAAGPLGTTAATVTVGGRVLDNAGNPLSNVVLTLTDSSGGVVVTRTNAFGYFTFDEVKAGQAYIVNLSSRAQQFVPQVLNVIDSLNGLEFRALP